MVGVGKEEKEDREASTGALKTKFLLWADGAQIKWGPLGDSVEHASESFYSEDKEAGVICPPAPILYQYS